MGKQAQFPSPPFLPIHSDLTRCDQKRNFVQETSPVVCNLGFAREGEIQKSLDGIERHVGYTDLNPGSGGLCLASDYLNDRGSP